MKSNRNYGRTSETDITVTEARRRLYILFRAAFENARNEKSMETRINASYTRRLNSEMSRYSTYDRHTRPFRKTFNRAAAVNAVKCTSDV